MASMTLGQLKRQVMAMCGAHVDALRVETTLALKLIEIGESRSWSWRKGNTLLKTVAPHSEGTVALNVDTTKIDGTGSAFTAADVGSYIRVSLDVGFYRITAVVGQQLTLETGYAGSTFTGSTYTIFRHIYALASDFGQMEAPAFWNRIRETTLTELAEWDARRTFSDIPSHFAFAGRDSNGVQLVEIWPIPSSVIAIRYAYLKSLAITSGDATRIEMRPDVLTYAAAEDCLMRLVAEKPERFGALLPLAARYGEKGVKSMDEYVVEDQRRAGTPPAIRDYETVEAFQNTFTVGFDPSYL